MNMKSPDEIFYSSPELIIALRESMDQPKSPSEARLHRRNFPSNLSEVANCKDDNYAPEPQMFYIQGLQVQFGENQREAGQLSCYQD